MICYSFSLLPSFVSCLVASNFLLFDKVKPIKLQGQIVVGRQNEFIPSIPTLHIEFPQLFGTFILIHFFRTQSKQQSTRFFFSRSQSCYFLHFFDNLSYSTHRFLHTFRFAGNGRFRKGRRPQIGGDQDARIGKLSRLSGACRHTGIGLGQIRLLTRRRFRQGRGNAGEIGRGDEFFEIRRVKGTAGTNARSVPFVLLFECGATAGVEIKVDPNRSE